MDETPLRNMNEGWWHDGQPNEDELACLEWLQKNDPQLTSFWISWDDDDFIPRDGDWERAGKYIGNHTYLEELYFGRMGNSTTMENLELLCAGISSNKSIKTLNFRGCDLFGDTRFITSLSRFFETNSKLHSINFSDCSLEPECMCILGSALDKREKRILISLDNINGGDECAAKIISSLFKNPDADGVYRLHFTNSNIGRLGSMSLADVLKDQRYRLLGLYISGNSIDDEGLLILTEALAGNDSLKELGLSQNPNITMVGWQAFYTFLRSPRCCLTELSLSEVALNTYSAIPIAVSLTKNHSLRRLDLSKNPGVADTGWLCIAAVLELPDCMLEKLDLRQNSLTEDVVTALARALVGNNRVTDLDLSGRTVTITEAGVQSFIPVFESATTSLERLYFDSPIISDATAIDIAAALAHNNKLESLPLFGQRAPSAHVCRAFDQLLCDKASVLNTSTSNHTLRHLGFYIEDNSLSHNLRINISGNKQLVARKKIIEVHLVNSNRINIQPFFDMESKEMPLAIAWMAKRCTDKEYGMFSRMEHDGLSLLYQCMRNMPSLLDLKGALKADHKRKRET